MAHRIAKVNSHYEIQSNKILGFIPCNWHTVDIEDPLWPMVTRKALFSTKEDAIDAFNDEFCNENIIFMP